MELNNYQWKLIYDAVSKKKSYELVGSKWYEEYEEILSSIYDSAHKEENKI